MKLHPIIFVIKQPQAGADGGTASIGEIITRLRRHRPIVVVDRVSRRVEEWRAAGIEVHIVPQVISRGFARNPLGVAASYVRYTLALRRLLAQTGSKIVHANDPGAMQLALAAAKMTRGTKIALNMRDTRDSSRKPDRRRFNRLFAAADHIFFLSRDMADRWATIAPAAKHAYGVTYSIVDPQRFHPSPPFAGSGPPVVLLSGLIRPKKGQLDFIRQVAPILADNGVSTWLAGDFEPSSNDYMASCANAAAPLGEAVKFLGFRTDVPALMRRATVVGVPSRHEGLVRAMIEGMASARPVVSFDVSSAREMLEREAPGSGVVLNGGDFEGMAKAILHYCRNPVAAAEAGKAGSAAAARLFTPRDVVERYESVYDKLGSSAS